MIILKELRWSNCFSYGENNTLELNDSTVTQILGHNGAGKSSIPLIIEEVLFNKNSKGIKKGDIQNRKLKSGYSISLTFSKESYEYKISVKRVGATLKAVLTENGEDISSHTATNTYKTLQNILGLDFKTFSQVVYQSTNSSLQFLTATDTNRKKFLIDLLHLELYVQLHELFKKESASATQELSSIEGKISTVEKWLETNILESSEVQPLLEDTISLEKDQETIRSIKGELLEISEKNRKIQENNKYRELLDSIDLNSHDESLTIQSYDEFQAEAGEWKAKGTSAKTMIQKLEKLGSKCPTCEQDVDSEFKLKLIDKETQIVNSAKEKLQHLKEKIDGVKSNNALVRAREQAQKDWEELYRSINSSLPTILLNAEELKERLTKAQTALDNKLAEKKKIALNNESIIKTNAKIKVIEEQKSYFENQKVELTKALRKIDVHASNLDMLKKAFSTNGLIAYKIENLVKELEDLVNEYLAELSDGRFTLSFIINKDKLNVSLTDNAAEVDISALSSGELARVNTSTLLAIRKLMSSISKTRINILFLDEVISTLDENGREKLVEVLTSEDTLNTYLVSHQWEHPLLSKLSVSKEDGISRIETS